jgi:endoglucanase
MNQRSHVLCRSFLLISLLPFLSQNLFADELAKAATAQEAADNLGVGINLGNMLDAPNEGDWGVRFENDYASIIRKAGFQHVRLPVKWSAHASTKAPFRIDPAFVARVKTVMAVCTKQGLRVVLNIHHYDEMHVAPGKETDRFLAIWRQLSDLFASQPETVYFEILNEPHDNLTTQEWNKILPLALDIIRKKNPNRAVILGGGNWNSPDELIPLKLPAEDQMLIATVHYYRPHEFTHQGAEFLGDKAPPAGRKFPFDQAERTAIEEDFQRIADWSVKNHRPVYVGEFGCYHIAPGEDRLRWTRTVAGLCRKHKFGSAYWEFCSGFGAWDPASREWRDELLDAIIHP